VLPHSVPVHAQAGVPPSAEQSGVGCVQGTDCSCPLAVQVSTLLVAPASPHRTVFGVHEPVQAPASQAKGQVTPASSHRPRLSQLCGSSPTHCFVDGMHMPVQPAS
jgi:hypothetical protein